MTKNKWMIVFIVVVILVAADTDQKKEAGSTLRSFSPDPVAPNTNFDVTYTSSSTGFNGIEDTLQSGFTLVTTGDSLVALNGNLLKVAWTGTSKTITLKSPAEGTYAFSGTFEGTGDISGSISGDSSLLVQQGATCTPVCTSDVYEHTCKQSAPDGCGGECTRVTSGQSCESGGTCSNGMCTGGTSSGTLLRTFSPDPVQPSSTVKITYTSSSTGFNGIEDTIPAGFTLLTQNSLVSLNNNLLKAAWTGASTTIDLQSPSSTGTYSFSGTFEGTGDAVGSITGDSSLSVSSGTTTTPECTLDSDCATGQVCTAEVCVAEGTTTPPAEGDTCEEKKECEIWEECGKDDGPCQMAGWAKIVMIGFALMFFTSMIK